MAQLLVLVLDQEERVSDVLEAWEQMGVPGVTMLNSTGSTHENQETRDDLPFVVSLRSVLEAQEKETRTLFSVIENDSVVEQAAAAVLRIIPDFAEGHRGIMFTTPILQLWGMYPNSTQQK